jgi:hypothetical protein
MVYFLRRQPQRIAETGRIFLDEPEAVSSARPVLTAPDRS